MAKHIYQDKLKPFVQDKILQSAEQMHLNQEEIAELLAIDSRSYAYIKAGDTMCSASTLVMYLAKICPDPMGFLEQAREVIRQAEEAEQK